MGRNGVMDEVASPTGGRKGKGGRDLRDRKA